MSADALRPDLPDVVHDHPDVTGGWLRPAVFGAMDGLVSNLALIAGVAGGTRHAGSSSAVLLAGVAGLVGGAFSMATGEYVLGGEPVRGRGARDRQGAPGDHAQPGRRDRRARGDVRREGPRRRPGREGRPTDPRRRRTPSPYTPGRSSVLTPATSPRPGSPLRRPSCRSRSARSSRCFPYLLGSTSLVLAVSITLLALFACGAVVAQVTVRPWWYGGSRQVP